MSQSSNRTNPHLPIRSHLHAGAAGDVCWPTSTNCVAYDTINKKPRGDIWNNCNDGKAFAGDKCLDAIKATPHHVGITCYKC